MVFSYLATLKLNGNALLGSLVLFLHRNANAFGNPARTLRLKNWDSVELGRIGSTKLPRSAPDIHTFSDLRLILLNEKLLFMCDICKLLLRHFVP